MRLLVQSLAIGAGGFVGAVARFLLGKACGWLFETTFPVGTLVINVSGCFILAWFITLTGDRWMVRDPWKLAFSVGFVGAYTTFSTWMWESNKLFEDGAEIKAIANVVVSLVLGLLAVKAGIVVARHSWSFGR